MADKSRSVPSIGRELGGVPACTVYHYLHADGTLKATGLKVLGQAAALDLQESVAASGTLPRAV
nr:hypothetical protein [uncultured Lichenicoccus sp.]